MKLSIGFSPCPNDTFIFDALVNRKIDTGELNFEVVMEDVETLNRMALQEKLDITKISYGVLSKILPAYQVLDSGGALGLGVGPLLITAKPISPETISEMTIALPGLNTTAHMLFSLAFPAARKKMFIPFYQIEDAVLRGDADAGVIIHENRFTYESKGLHKVMDLGDYWEKNTGNPIPLGGIVMNRRYEKRLMTRVSDLIRQSLEYSRNNYPELSDFIRNNAQEMEDDVMRKHIGLYVNDYSLQLGPRGRAAVWQMLEIAGNLSPQPVAGSYEVFI
ncbi:MAG TPA: 1,4-dihydroxy-6-naphthoate synthase [Chitinophagaceae bacterium]|nr:1,4-dihydroxy-6-naphthoate synthase [Chitinophagaceae bacterium]